MLKEKEEQIEEFRSVIEANRSVIREYEAKEEGIKNGIANRAEKEKEKDKER